MGVGLSLRARANGAEPLAALRRCIEARYSELIEHVRGDERFLAVCLHPAAEEVEFARDGAFVTVSAKTSTVGPGYHAFVCEVLHHVARELRWTWDAGDGEDGGDETGFFSSGDVRALEDHMLGWLRGICTILAERVAEGATDFMVSLPMNPHYEFDGVMATPMGPRDASWLDASKEDPSRGIDVFPWWEPGLGAHHALGRASVRMWTDVRWRAPVTPEEERLLAKIDADLRHAYRQDPSLALPWAEWAEILGWLESDDAIAREVIARVRGHAATIGYRRRPVRTSLPGGWSVRVPGEMSSEFDDEGTWSAFSPGRTIWMSSFRIGDPDAPTLTAEQTLPNDEEDGERVDVPELPEDYARRARKTISEEGEIRLTVEIAKPHRIAVFTFVLDDARDVEWAKHVAGSVRHRSVP